MKQSTYLMESEDEALRLDLKTDQEAVARQALWAGLKPGMRVADIGCGSGKTSFFLHGLVQPGGTVAGIDGSERRIVHARGKYIAPGLEFHQRDFYEPLEGLGSFDFIWVRFVLEYHQAKAFDIVRNIASLLKAGGILCLIDLDYNCLTHFGLPARLENAVIDIMKKLEKEADFDPFIGRKLYSYLYDLGFDLIKVDLSAHHLIIGELNEVDAYNWTRKVEVAAKNSGYDFSGYPGGYEGFFEEFRQFFNDPRRFTYTPLICCRGRKIVK